MAGQCPDSVEEEEDFVSVKLSSRESGEVSILDIAGSITLGESANQLRAALNDLISRNRKQLLLNLSGLTFIDSSGIREVMSAFLELGKNGGKLKLLHPTQRVKDLLRITKLHTIFEIYDDEATAISSFT
jgi:anti-sigma B factor antagonist